MIYMYDYEIMPFYLIAIDEQFFKIFNTIMPISTVLRVFRGPDKHKPNTLRLNAWILIFRHG